MKEHTEKLDLIDFIRFGWKRKKVILIIAFVASLITAVIMFFTKNKYKAYGSFFPASSAISGRVNLFREFNQEWLDLFGGENEADRLYVIGNTATVVSKLIEENKMHEHYGIDIVNDPKGKLKTYKRFAKNYSFNRSGFKHLEVTFSDVDPELGAKIVNSAMNFSENELKKVYINGHSQMAIALEKRVDSIGQRIDGLTDTLVKLRTKHGIYDLLSPGRKNILSGKMSGGGASYARALEEIQEVEEVKDRLVIEKGKYAALSNEFRALLHYDIPMIHVVQWATPSGQKAGPFRILTVLLVGVGSFLFAWLLLVMYEYILRNKDRFTLDD
jgi:hypothetical protein